MTIKTVKNPIFAAMAGALLLAGCSSDKTVVKGVIEGYQGEFTEFFLPDTTYEGGFREIEIKVAEDGSFKAVLDLQRSYYDAPLFVDKVMFRTCIEKGKTYNARFNVTDPSVETDFSFEGEGALENEFTRDWWNGFGIPYGFLQECGDVTDFKGYKAYIEAQSEVLKSKLAEIGNEGFTAYYAPKIDENVNSFSFYYPYIAAYNGEDPFKDDEFNAYLASDICADMTEDEFAAFFNGVSGVIASVFSDMDILKVMKIAEKTTSASSRNHFAMTSLLMNFINMAGQNNLEAAYKYYRKVCKEPEYVSQVEGLFKTASVLVKGADAPAVEFVDEDGKTHSLSEFKGKALYVDIWASWCGPCRAEIPYLEKLYEALGPNSEIQCISISIDDNRQDWIDKLGEDNPTWPQFLVTEKGQGQIANDYNIRAIPRFMLFDAQGRIVTVDAPRPSTPNIKEKLLELLK